MAISVRATGTWARMVTDNGTVTIPGTPQAGDRMFLIGTWKDYAITVANPTGWTSLGKYADGTTGAGNGSGSVAIQVWYRDWQSGDGNPAIDYSTAPTEGGWVIQVLAKGSTDTWDTPTVVNAAISAATSWTATASSTLTVKSGAIVLGVAGFRDDSATMTRGATTGLDHSAGTMTWNGNYVESPATHWSSTTGLDMSADAGYRLVTTGGTGITLRMQGTLSASESGAAYWVHQGVSVPNVNAALGDLAGGTASASSGAGRKGAKAALGAVSGTAALASGAGRKGAKSSSGASADYQHTWAWPSSADGWTLTATQGASITAGWHASGAMLIQGPVLVGEDQDQVGYVKASGTWASLFGASGNVTQVRLDGVSTWFANIGANIGTVSIGPVSIYSGGNWVATLWGGRTVPQGTNEGGYTNTGAQSAQAVGASYQASGTSIEVRVGYTTGYDTVDDQSVLMYLDNLAVTAQVTGAGSSVIEAAYTMAATGEKGQGLDRFAALGNLASGTSQSLAGRKGAKVALGSLAATPGFALVGRKAVSRAAGTITAGTSMAATGRKSVSRAAGAITSTASLGTGTGRKGTSRALGAITSTAALASGTGRKGARAALASTATTSLAAQGRKAARVALGDLAATTAMAATGEKVTDDRTAALGNLAVAAALAAQGRKSVSRAAGNIALATTLAAQGRHGTSRALGTITSAASATAGAGRKGARASLSHQVATTQAATGRKAAKVVLAHPVTTSQALVARKAVSRALGNLAVSTSQAMTGTQGVSNDKYAALGDLASSYNMAATGRKGAARALGTVTSTASLASGLGRKGGKAALVAAFAPSMTLAARKGGRGQATMALEASLTAQARTSRAGVAHQSAGYLMAVLGVPGRAGAAGDIALAWIMAAAGAANQSALVGDEVAASAQDAYAAQVAGPGASLAGDGMGATILDGYQVTITEG